MRPPQIQKVGARFELGETGDPTYRMSQARDPRRPTKKIRKKIIASSRYCRCRCTPRTDHDLDYLDQIDQIDHDLDLNPKLPF